MEAITDQCLAIAELSAALMSEVYEQNLHGRLYQTRVLVDGYVGNWSSCALVAVCAYHAFNDLWRAGVREYLDDVPELARLMVEVSEEAPIRELPRAWVAVERLLSTVTIQK